MTSGEEQILTIKEEEDFHVLYPEDSDVEDNINVDEEIVLEQDIDEVSFEQFPFLEQCSSTSEVYKGIKRKAKYISEDPKKIRRIHDEIVVDGPKPEYRLKWSNKFTPIPNKESTYPFGDVKAKFQDIELTPYNIFIETICFPELSALILEQTEIYTRQKGIEFRMEEDELKAFIGINLIMGYHVLPHVRDYWSTSPDMGVPFIASTMTRTRFENIAGALHFSNNDTADKNDRACKVRPLITHFNKSFQDAREPSKRQSIDENMIKFRGQNEMKQFIKNKPIQWGFKLWCRCDSLNGYLYEFDLYQGKNDDQHGLGEGVVLKLCKSIENLNCEIYFNKFFNSPALQATLLEKGIYACGTMQKNRGNLPSDFTADKNMKRGDVEFRASGSISCLKWMDSKSVLMASNFLSPLDVIKVSRKQTGSTDKLQITCPTMFKNYTAYVGGVDVMDQKKCYYQADRRWKIKYYWRIFFDLIDICVNNSCIIYNQIAKKRGIGKTLSLLEFRRELARSLMSEFRSRSRAVPQSKTSDLSLDITIKHIVKKSKDRRRCALCYQKKLERRTNCLCGECNIYLCVTSTRNCFDEYHNNIK